MRFSPISSLVLGPNLDDKLVEFVVAICSVVIALNNKLPTVCPDWPPIGPAWFVVGIWLVRDKGCSLDVAGPFRCVRFGGSVLIVSLPLLRHSTRQPQGSAPIGIITFNTMVISRR